MKDLGKTISTFRKENKLSQGQLAARLGDFGLTPSSASLSAWEKGVSLPNALQLLAICKVLGIRDIWSSFIDDTDGLLAGLNNDGIRKVQEYVSLLRLAPEYRATGDSSVPSFSGSAVSTGPAALAPSVPAVSDVVSIHSSVRSFDRVRVLRLYSLPASAGTGEFLDGEDYTEVEVGGEVPAASDFGIRIKGDSMEPRYQDGQIAWVERTETLRSGEIGIFFHEGNAYIKKLHITPDGIFLVSLNPDYAPIPVSYPEDLITFGRVLN